MSEKITRSSGLRPPSTSSLRPPQINTKVGPGAKRTLNTTSSTENLAKRPKPTAPNNGTSTKVIIQPCYIL